MIGVGGRRFGLGPLAQTRWAHVCAAVDELEADTGERQPVALDKDLRAGFRLTDVRPAQKMRQGSATVVGRLQLPCPRPGRLERHFDSFPRIHVRPPVIFDWSNHMMIDFYCQYRFLCSTNEYVRMSSNEADELDERHDPPLFLPPT